MSGGSLAQSPLPSPKPSKISHSRTLSDESAASKKSGKSFLSQVHAVSQLATILKDLKEDVVNGRTISVDQDHAQRTTVSYLSGADNVYIEHNGKYMKAPKQMLDFDLIENKKEDVEPRSRSALDLAIWVQRHWSKLAYFCAGLMGGLSLLEFILVLKLLPSDESNREKFFQIYPFLGTTLSTLFFVCFNFSLVALLDWIDLGHLYAIRVGDKLQFKKIIAILIFVFSAFILSLANTSSDDSFALHESTFSNHSFTDGDSDLKQKLVNWEFLCLWKDGLVIIAWFLLVVSKNEDLFLYHMLALKKYDYPTTVNNIRLVLKRQNSNV